MLCKGIANVVLMRCTAKPSGSTEFKQVIKIILSHNPAEQPMTDLRANERGVRVCREELAQSQ